MLAGAAVYGAEPNRDAWQTALDRGVTQVFADVSEFAPLELDVIVDFAGFGTTTAGAIEAIKEGGRVVQVGLGRSEATISKGTLIMRRVTLVGSSSGHKHDVEAVLGLMAQGDLEIVATTIGFDDIPAGLEQLEHGRVVGRLAAALA